MMGCEGIMTRDFRHTVDCPIAVAQTYIQIAMETDKATHCLIVSSNART